MTVVGLHRGRRMFFDGKDWRYSSDGERMSSATERDCGHCEVSAAGDGHDPCLGELPHVVSACCGHGIDGDAWVTVRGKSIKQKIVGEMAIRWFRIYGKGPEGKQ